MSALAGVWRLDGKPQPDGDCARMLATQQIYGPDDGRQWCDGALAMGRRLFRTNPEDIYDHQPLHSRDGRLTLVADVRLDNREDLVAELGLPLAEAGRLCDAAILFKSLDHWGEGALTRLVGDFVFALWNAPAQKLLLARDFAGQRPLHYHRGNGFFAFASMAKGLHALPDIPYGPDEQMVAEFLVLMPQQGSRSFFKDVARVEPGHVVTVMRDCISSRRYWQPQPPRGNRLRSSEYIEGVRYHLDQATNSRLRGTNGIVGSHLSSGLDSSAVTATAARLLAPRGGKVVAFTSVPRVGCDASTASGEIADEGPLAAATVAMYANVEHVLIRGRRNSPIEDLDRAFYLYERPRLNLCNLSWLSAIDHAACERNIKVMLIGTMGNMTVSRSGLELFPELLLAGRFRRLWREAAAFVKVAGASPRGTLLQILGPLMPVWLWQWALRKAGQWPADVFEYTAIAAECFSDRHLAAHARHRGLDFSYRPRKDGFTSQLWALTRLGLGEMNKGRLAQWGIDHRDPFSDRRLVEFCLTIPSEEYLSNGLPRALARRALADRLPALVVNERKSAVQAVDWHEGLTAARDEVAAELQRLSGFAPAATILDIGRLSRLVENWPTSGWHRTDITYSYRLALLRGISAGHFLRKASGAN